MAASSRVDITISKETLEQISGLSLALAAGFDVKRIDKALSAAALFAAKGQVKPVKAAAPRKTGRLRRAIWANPVMKSKPGAYVGIRAGKSRADTKGAYYRYIVTSGVKRVPYSITPKRKSGAQALLLPPRGSDLGYRFGVTRTTPIKGRPFVEETVSRNFNTILRMFGDALTSILERGIPKRGRVRVRLPKPR